jgi:hypothetical protein
VLFEPRLRRGIGDGSITIAFRRWKRPQVVAGRRYRTGEGLVDVTAVDVVAAESAIDADDIRRAGYSSLDELVRQVPVRDGTSLYRLELRRADATDPRDTLAASDSLSADDIAEVTHRLDRLDRSSTSGPWTRATLAAIAAEPGRRAPDLAAAFGRETLPFKRDVRKLKELGLTISLPVGYELSPRGEAFTRAAGIQPKPAASSTKRAARKTAAP